MKPATFDGLHAIGDTCSGRQRFTPTTSQLQRRDGGCRWWHGNAWRTWPPTTPPPTPSPSRARRRSERTWTSAVVSGRQQPRASSAFVSGSRQLSPTAALLLLLLRQPFSSGRWHGVTCPACEEWGGRGQAALPLARVRVAAHVSCIGGSGQPIIYRSACSSGIMIHARSPSTP